MKYPDVKDGEWVQPIKKQYTMICCDCGLIHAFDFRIRNNRTQFRAFRKQRRTGQYRRYNNIKVKEVANG